MPGSYDVVLNRSTILPAASAGTASPATLKTNVAGETFAAALHNAQQGNRLAQAKALHAVPEDLALPPKIEAKVQKAAEDMEAMFVGMLLKSMWKTIPEGEYSMKGTAGEIYRDMFIEQVSKMASSGPGIGLKQVIRRELVARETAVAR